MRKQLRKACTRFLRFSYLLDFIALDALSKVYLSSVKDTHEKLKDLSDGTIDFDLV
jgi:dynein heavy chain